MAASIEVFKPMETWRVKFALKGKFSDNCYGIVLITIERNITAIHVRHMVLEKYQFNELLRTIYVYIKLIFRLHSRYCCVLVRHELKGILL